MDTYPPEIIHKILLQLTYLDVLNYCAVNTKTKIYYTDFYFWTLKLDADFKIGTKLLPSQYIKSYATIDIDEKCYRRWYKAKQNNYIKVGNFNRSLEDFTEWYNAKRLGPYIIDDLDILVWLLDNYDYDILYKINTHIMNNCIDQLLNFAIYNDRADILSKLECKIPNRFVFKEFRQHCLRSLNINTLHWLNKIAKQLGADVGGISTISTKLRIMDVVFKHQKT